MDSPPGHTRSTWDKVRRRIAPVALVAALAVLATQTCEDEAAHVQVTLDLGAARDAVERVRVDVFREGPDQNAPSVAVFERAYGQEGALSMPSFEARLARGTYRLFIEVTLHGRARRVERVIEVRDQASIRVALERELMSG